jgi:uncharacterized protein YegL
MFLLEKITKFYKKDQQGGVAILAAVSVSVLALVSGMGIDMGYATITQSKLSQAADAAGLAAATATFEKEGGSDRQKLAERFFALNTADIRSVDGIKTGGVSVQISGDINQEEGRIVKVAAHAETKVRFMKLQSDLEKINVSAYSEAAVQQDRNDMDLLLSLDTSGSMRGTNIAGVAQAVASLMDDIFNEKNQSSSINIANVTFAADVRDVTPWTSSRSELEGYYAYFLNDAYIGGGTNNGASLQRSYSMMQSRTASSDAQKVVIALTDGKNTVGSDGEMLSACDDLKRDNVLVYTISFGAAAGSSASRVMARCSSGPEYALEARNAGELTEAFKEILVGIKMVRLVN